MDLFEAAAEITRPTKAKPAPADLKVFEYDDIGLGSCIHCHYSVDWDDSRADVWIHRIELNTGQHLVPLALTDIPGVDLKAIEAVIAEQEEVEAHDAALALARDPNNAQGGIMLGKLSETIKKYANGWLMLVFFAGEIFFNAVVLPARQAKIQAGSGGMGPIDLQFFYTPEKVYGMIASYGAEVRASYRAFELTGDIIYPIVYTLFFSLLITWLFQRGFASVSKMQKYNILPFGGWLFDLLENLGIVTMLSVYPSTPAALARISAIFTLTKWLFAGATLVFILIGLAMAIKNGFKKQS